MAYLLEPSQDPDGLDVDAKPFPRPRAGERHLWHLYEEPHVYVPFLVRVLARKDAEISFVILDAQTGEDRSKTITGNVVDASRIYGFSPSTAQAVVPGQAEDCGFLFLTQQYLDELVASNALTRAQLASASSTGKWPKGAATLASALRKLVSSPETTERLRADEFRALKSLLATLG